MTQILTDTFGVDPSGTNLTAHTPTVGGAWSVGTSYVGTILLDGSGGVYMAGTNGHHSYVNAAAFPTSSTLTYTADLVLNSQLNYFGIGVYDGAGNNYHISHLSTSFAGGSGWAFEKQPAGSNGTTLFKQQTTPTVVNHTYTITLVVTTDGTTVTISGSVYDVTAAATVFTVSTTTDTTYPAVNHPGVRGFTNAADTASTGPHLKNLSASYTTPAPSLSVSPTTATAVDGSTTVSITPTRANSSAALTASVTGGGTISTASPTSGTPFTYTPPGSGTGTATVTVTDATDSLTATCTITYAPASAPALVVSPTSGTATDASTTLSITPTLSNSSAALTASVTGGGTISTTTPTSGVAFTYTPPTTGSGTATVTVTDATDGLSQGCTITYAPASVGTIPVTDANLFFSPATWVVAGGVAKTNCAGAYFKVGFTGTSCTLNLDTTGLGTSGLYLRVSVDGGAFVDTNINGRSTLVVATGLAAGNHSLVCYYRARDRTVESWTNPVNMLVVTGLTLDAGASTVAPTLAAKRMLILGDSRVEGTNALSVANPGGQDATGVVGAYWANAWNAEYGLAAFYGLGWTWTGATNVPPLFTPGNDANSSWNKIYSGVARSYAGYDYVVILNMGGNDYNHSASQASVQASVSGLLTAIRAANPSTSIFVVYSYEGKDQAYVQGGFNAYQAATPDAGCYLIDPGLTTAEKAAINGGSSYLSYDGVHPTSYAQAVIAGRVIQKAQAALAGVSTAQVIKSGQRRRGR